MIVLAALALSDCCNHNLEWEFRQEGGNFSGHLAIDSSPRDIESLFMNQALIRVAVFRSASPVSWLVLLVIAEVWHEYEVAPHPMGQGLLIRQTLHGRWTRRVVFDPLALTTGL